MFGGEIWLWARWIYFDLGVTFRKASSSLVKWQYLFSRYGGMAAQMRVLLNFHLPGIHLIYISSRGNTVVLSRLQLVETVPRQFCVAWYSLQLAFGHSLLLSLEISLILRRMLLIPPLWAPHTKFEILVFALYNQNHCMVAFLVILISFEAINTIFWGFVSLERAELVGGCVTKNVPVIVLYLTYVCLSPHMFCPHPFSILSPSVAQISIQGIIWTLTLMKCERKRIPLLTLIIRDSSWVFGSMLGV